MANNFPAVPGGYQLSGVSYSVTFPQPVVGGALVAAGTSYGVSGGLLGIGGTGTISVGFSTPGNPGAFDQAAAEAQISAILTDVCQLAADMAGVALAAVQPAVHVSRIWTWTAPDGSTATFPDVMPYP